MLNALDDITMTLSGGRLLGLFFIAVLGQPAAAQGLAGPMLPDTTIPSPATPHYWRDVSAGFASSLLIHEAGHVLTSIALGHHPSFGFDTYRPTIYSGIDAKIDPHDQFLFSSMGLNAQAVLDEAILDVPHHRGAPFERGLLASGIATALFYVTIGRTGSVSDIDFMSRTSNLTKTDLTIIYGSVAVLHTFRVSRDGQYANFFVRPAPIGEHGLRLGVHLTSEEP
jgi:hypothetical protein